ncbi:HAD family phosphatase [Actinomycetaceae bacterium WB03_NA08]|uniref:HAD family phosphatase n=1 Tax=Scrofimicrobium canadense TaxID=2652290 RepID=A0A6N7VNZ0_9ACTO|nr:HAD family phosphatase [Scrofimicrobium canadense]
MVKLAFVTHQFSAVFFDCDGVLVDSELITHRVFREMLIDLGWNISEEECVRRFIGKSFKDQAPLIYKETGYLIDDGWIDSFRRRRDDALRHELGAVPGAINAVATVSEAMEDRFACVSGADRQKIEMQLKVTGLAGFFGNRVFSGMETPRSKPAPDVYIAAAEAMGVDVKSSVIIEDSRAGVQAGLAAGATVLGFAGSGLGYLSAQELMSEGVTATFTSMDQLPSMIL